MTTCAPVALFVYNRPWHVCQTTEALLANGGASETQLYVYSDGPRDAASMAAVAEVRSFLRTLTGFKSVKIIERSDNFGLARSIIQGVTEVCDEHGRVIVMEDDLLTSPHFLRFMNDSLLEYQNDPRVISIHGYIYPVGQPMPETFFLRGADCWGWATWKRGWDLFEPDGRKLLRQLEEGGLTHQFDCDGSYPYTKMLRDQIAGKNNSWAIRWHASAFLQEKLTLYPGCSLVHNIGLDGSGVHCSGDSAYTGSLAACPVRVGGIEVTENQLAREAIVNFYRRTRRSLPMRAANKLLSRLRGKLKVSYGG